MGLFIRTIELHRSAAIREAQQESRVRRREVQTTFEDHEPVAAGEESASPDLGPVSYDDVQLDRCLRIRADLIEIASAEGRDAGFVPISASDLGSCSSATRIVALPGGKPAAEI